MPDTAPGGIRPIEHGLAGYVRAVAAAVGVPAEATVFEISDTATAYLGLAQRWDQRPAEDLMLVWDEHHGWRIAVETDPGVPPTVVDHLGGTDLVPEPQIVAGFVSDVLAARRPARSRPVGLTVGSRDQLAARLSHYRV